MSRSVKKPPSELDLIGTPSREARKETARHNALPPVALVTKLPAAVLPTFGALSFIFFPSTSNSPCSIIVNQTPCWHVLPLFPSWLLLPVHSCRCMKSHTLDPYSWLIKCNLKYLTPCQAHDHSGLKTAMVVFKYIYPFCYQQNMTQLSTEL